MTGRARPCRHVFIAIYYTPSAVIANYPVFGRDGKNTAKPSCFYRSILYALCNMLLKYCFVIGSFCGCFQGFFLWYHGTKAGNRYYSIRISAYPDTGRHISLILLMLMLASLSISRIVALIPWLSASMPLGSMPGQLRKTSGIHIPPVPHVWPLAGCTNQTTGT